MNTKCKGLHIISGTMFLLLMAFSSYGQSEVKKENEKKSEMNNQVTTKVKMSVTGMSCMGCVANVKNTIEELDGVQEVEVSLEDKEAIITYITSKVEPKKIQEAVNKKGFTAGEPVKQN